MDFGDDFSQPAFYAKPKLLDRKATPKEPAPKDEEIVSSGVEEEKKGGESEDISTLQSTTSLHS